MTWFPGSHFDPLENSLRFFPGLVLQGLLQQYKWPAAIVLVLLGLQAALIGILLYEQGRRKRANDALRAAARVFDTTGDSFFRSLTEHLNSLLRADYVSISELSADGLRLKTVAVSADGKNLENLEYLLAGTPCKKVLEQGRFFDRSEIQAHFPQDSFLAELGFQSYLGVALLDSAKRPLGVMSVLSRQRAKQASVVEATLEMFAARASAEMERRRSRQALEASEARNRAILRGIPDVMFVLDAEGTVLDYSASEQNELYTPPDQILGRHIREKLPADAAEAITRAASQATGASEPASVEFSLSMKSGVRFYDARIVPMETGKVLAIVRSITLQKQAELDL
ncbi:MAG TPA: GAF domain-containing protein, partial [Terriglobia bacterium]|nr:GAF domain-containing protein [Terriglobia bacterium]